MHHNLTYRITGNFCDFELKRRLFSADRQLFDRSYQTSDIWLFESIILEKDSEFYLNTVTPMYRNKTYFRCSEKSVR
jgi:hypothetical protein